MFLERIPVRFRLSVGHAAWMALLFLFIGVGVYKLVERNLNDSVDAALIASANSLRKSRVAISYRSPFTRSFLREFFGDNFRPYAQLVDLSGRVSASTENERVKLPVSPNAVLRAERGLVTIETTPRRGMSDMRIITMPVMRRGRFSGELIQVGATLDQMNLTLKSIELMLWIVMPLGLLMTIVFGYIWMALSLKPVRALTKAAANLSSDDLDTRLKLPKARDEIYDLTATFNQMLDRLQDAFTRLRRFAGDVSHELRTPLTVLRGEAELALRRDRSAASYQETLRVIAGESTHMTSIVEDLLLLARAQSGSVALSIEPIDLASFAKELSTSVHSVLEEKSIELEVDVNASHPLSGASGYLLLVFKNLLLNAVKHSASGSKVSFVIDQDSSASSIRFQVIDRGEGIPEEAIPYIFDAFYRADTARNRAASGGSGIGLSLAQALIKLHNGTIEVESEVGVGTTFTVQIPCGLQNEAERKKERQGATTTPMSGRSSPALVAAVPAKNPLESSPV